IADSKLTWEQIVDCVSNADEQQAESARLSMIQFRKFLRRSIRGEQRRENTTTASSNPLTLCGKSEREISEVLRSISVRITTAQLLSLLIVFTLVTDFMLVRLIKSLFTQLNMDKQNLD